MACVKPCWRLCVCPSDHASHPLLTPPPPSQSGGLPHVHGTRGAARRALQRKGGRLLIWRHAVRAHGGLPPCQVRGLLCCWLCVLYVSGCSKVSTGMAPKARAPCCRRTARAQPQRTHTPRLQPRHGRGRRRRRGADGRRLWRQAGSLCRAGARAGALPAVRCLRAPLRFSPARARCAACAAPASTRNPLFTPPHPQVAGGHREELPPYWPKPLKQLVAACWAQARKRARPPAEALCATSPTAPAAALACLTSAHVPASLAPTGPRPAPFFRAHPGAAVCNEAGAPGRGDGRAAAAVKLQPHRGLRLHSHVAAAPRRRCLARPAVKLQPHRRPRLRCDVGADLLRRASAAGQRRVLPAATRLEAVRSAPPAGAPCGRGRRWVPRRRGSRYLYYDTTPLPPCARPHANLLFFTWGPRTHILKPPC